MSETVVNQTAMDQTAVDQTVVHQTLLDPAAHAWQATWIEPVEPADGPNAHRPAYHLAGDLTVDGTVASAYLHATAHGIYEAFVNGTRVGDMELTPGFTAYRKRLQVHTFDVTNLLTEGLNTLGALLSDGWWRGQHGVIREIDAYGATTAFLAELHVTLTTGETHVFGTNAQWRSTPSHILAADLIAGEVHDLRKCVAGWAAPGTDRALWHPVQTVDHGHETLCALIGPPVRRIQELAAVSVTELSPGHHVVDFGQNSNGWVRLHHLGPAGTTITITYGEALDANGDVTQANVASGAFAAPRDIPFQTDTVISNGDDSFFEARHSTKGFQYVRIEGHHGTLDPASIVSIVVHTDLQSIGGFSCSDERINRLHSVADWSFRGNACEIPTDCPTRERSGWVGDWQIYVGTAAYLYNVTDWSAKWLRDLAADQLPDGRVTSIVPDPSPNAPIWKSTHGSSGWGDAAVHVPWELYLATGRIDMLTDHYEAMRKWVEFAVTSAAKGRHRSRQERDPEPHADLTGPNSASLRDPSAGPLPTGKPDWEPSAHEQFLWDTGWHFGEWLEPGVNMENVLAQLRIDDHGPVATAYLYRSCSQLAAIARLLGDESTADHYSDLATNVRNAWRTEFINADGRVQPQTQANLVRALKFGLIPANLEHQASADLVALVKAADNHLGTGFLATPFLLPVLADHGHLDVAYELLFQDSEPSWLHMSERYSTIWEDWDGMRADGRAVHSLNHYSKGAVISFLHHYVAGLQLVDPGYTRVRIAPHPGGGITHAQTHHDTPQGRIAVSWNLEAINHEQAPTGGQNQQGTIKINLPPGTDAELILPDGSTVALTPGEHQATWTSS
jgi:alpha-L-rhamnosidase